MCSMPWMIFSQMHRHTAYAHDTCTRNFDLTAIRRNENHKWEYLLIQSESSQNYIHAGSFDNILQCTTLSCLNLNFRVPWLVKT